MAKITLENTREHELSITGLDEDGNFTQVVIPAATQHPTNQGKFVNGTAEADGAFVAAMTKKSKVIQHYFDEGWLVSSKPTADKKDGKTE